MRNYLTISWKKYKLKKEPNLWFAITKLLKIEVQEYKIFFNNIDEFTAENEKHIFFLITCKGIFGSILTIYQSQMVGLKENF